ncbi:hypothetical protein ACHAWF_003399 [Thalassiosira exigua]
MGGDDLASDDEFLFESGLVDTSGGRGTALPSSDEDEGSSDGDNVGADIGLGEGAAPSSPKKRKGAGNDASGGPSDPSSSNKRRKRNDGAAPSSSKGVLIRAGRGIATDGVDAQAVFLGTLYVHSLKLSEGASGVGSRADGDGEDDSPVAFSFRPHLYSPPEGIDEKTKRFRHSNLDAFLKSGPLPSMKRLKNWKQPHSPMVIVVTISARRSVELMKQLSSLKLPVAKLFAKHMSVENQAELLRGMGKPGKGRGGGGGGKGGGGRCYSLAVGTPGRLLKLMRHGRDVRGGAGGALRLKHTEIVVVDCHEDVKGWTVCTLNDTSNELMEFMKEGVVPEMKRRKGKIKLALF